MSHLLVVVKAVGGSRGVCVVLMRGAGVGENLLLL
jgi:hypothetical protein